MLKWLLILCVYSKAIQYGNSVKHDVRDRNKAPLLFSPMLNTIYCAVFMYQSRWALAIIKRKLQLKDEKLLKLVCRFSSLVLFGFSISDWSL